MSDLSYWERRAAQRMFEYMQSAEETADDIAKLYQKSSGYISHELDMIFERFQKKHKLSEAEARRLLSMLQDKDSIDELKLALKNGSDDKTKAEILAELEAPAYQARLERLQQLQNQIDMTMQSVYQQEKLRNTSHYVDLANESYYKSIFDIQQRTGLGFSFNRIDPKEIDTVINSKWSGSNYSTRIWHNTSALAQDLKEELLVNLLTGRTDREAAEIIANKFAQGASNARRLVRTESCNLSNQMEMLSYEECGIETYIFVATLDLRTSSKCRSLDGKRYKVSEQQTGLNCPPMHPWCRSTTICDITDEELAQMKRKARDPVTGRTYNIPANMTYEQWYNQNVKGKPEAELKEYMNKNSSADKKQYEKYRDLLGDDVPETLDSFQKMKYTEGEKWKFTKLDYKRRNELIRHPELKLPNAENAVLPEGKFTKYLLGGNNEKGLAKGKAFTSRLGYDINNWEKLQEEIRQGVSKYPAADKGSSEFGTKYEQKMILYGMKETPANVIVGWIKKTDGSINMTSAYIKEVD